MKEIRGQYEYSDDFSRTIFLTAMSIYGFIRIDDKSLMFRISSVPNFDNNEDSPGDAAISPHRTTLPVATSVVSCIIDNGHELVQDSAYVRILEAGTTPQREIRRRSE